MIFGTPEDRNIIKLIKWINKYPIIPIPGNGSALQRPIYVKDLSWAVVESILSKNHKKNYQYIWERLHKLYFNY